MAYYKCGKIFATQNSNTSIETASGAIANFNTSLAMPVLDCIAEFSATQDLHGQSAPYPAGGGKNKFSIDFLTASGITISNSEASGSASTFADKFGATKFIPNLSLGANTQYTISFDAYTDGASTSGTGLYIAFKYDDDSTSDARCPNNTLSYTRFSVSNDTSKNLVGIYISYSSKSSNIWYLKNIQLEEGSPATTYHPYSNICPIVGVDKVNVTRTGKNLFNFDTVTAYNANVTVTKLNGDISVQNSNGYTLNALNGSEVYLKSGTYTISISEATTAAINIYKGGSWIASGISVGNTSGTFTITNSDTYNLTANVAGNSTITIKKLQIEKGSTATAYEAYNGVTKTLDLGGDYYGGEVDALSGKITLTHGVVDMGSLSWTKTGATQFNLFRATVSDIKENSSYSTAPNLLCPIYKTVAPDDRANHTIYVQANQGHSVDVIDNDCADAPELTSRLDGVIMAYELATPIVVYASNTAELYTKAGLNNIYCDTGNIEVKYRRITQ